MAEDRRSWLSALTKEEFKVLLNELVTQLQPLLVQCYTGYLTDKITDGVAQQLVDDGTFQRRVVTAVLLLAATQIAEDRTAPPVTWVCTCGIINGVNLEKCRVCGRREGEAA